MFLFFETTAAGEPKEQARRIHPNEIVTHIRMRCPRIDRKRVQHIVDLAHAAPNNPFDVAHFEKGAHSFSGRLMLLAYEMPHAKQYIDCSACGLRHMRGQACPVKSRAP